MWESQSASVAVHWRNHDASCYVRAASGIHGGVDFDYKLQPVSTFRNSTRDGFMRFGKLLLVSVVGAIALSMSSAGVCHAQEGSPGGRVAELKDQLEGGLKARLPHEFLFIAVVVDRVEKRQLSTGEVKSIFQWARRKNKVTPFPYFERAMRIIAARKGVSL